MRTRRIVMLAASLGCLVTAGWALANWSVAPGAEVRNAFGVQAGSRAHQCPGACGAGCTDQCEKSVTYECVDADRLRRVVTYACGTHAGCRVHDDCLDACLDSKAVGGDCQSKCDTEVVQQYGAESALSWLRGGGPYDGQVSYQYTRDAAGALEPAYRCPAGATRQCAGMVGCIAANNTPVDPVFDSYPTGPGAMQISEFRSGPACGERVCATGFDIPVSGTEECVGGNCTRFGMEFDYRNADPSAPLECSTSTSGGEDDFIGGLLKLGGDAMVTRADPSASDGQGQDGMAEMLGMFAKVLASGDSPEDVNVSIAPLDEQGRPIESQRVGSTPSNGLPPIPRTVDIPAAKGHLFVPMYQLTEGMQPGEVKERRVRCTHKGEPVLETLFRLHAG